MGFSINYLFVFSYCLASCCPGFEAKFVLRIIQEWAELDFVFPNETVRQIALEKQYYIPGSPVPMDVDVHHANSPEKSKTFITIPRFKEGRPITLGILQDDGRIRAYPDYSWHDNQDSNCDGLTSVFRVAIDKCNRLWVFDTGRIEQTQVCPPKLLAFDLDTNEVIFRHKVDEDKYSNINSQLITPVVDETGRGPNDCSGTYVYVAHCYIFGLLVIDVDRNRSWRIFHKHFFPYPSHGSFYVDDVSFDIIDGVYGMALSPQKHDGFKNLYFHALASVKENVVRTNVLQNDSFLHSKIADPNSISVLSGERPNQSAAEAINKDGILFFGIMEPPSIWCWNSATEFTQKNFHQIAMDRKTLLFANGVKIVNNLDGEEELWILTNNFQRDFNNGFTADRINFNVLSGKVSTILENSPCIYSVF